jgi:hypothetical protein
VPGPRLPDSDEKGSETPAGNDALSRERLAGEERLMTRVSKVLVVLVVLALGVWGCTRGPANGGGQGERVRALEGRCAKIEQDYRSAASARDQARKQVSAAEEENGQLRQELANHSAAAKDREDLQRQVKAARAERDSLLRQVRERTGERDEMFQQLQQRSGERDSFQGRCERLERGLQKLLQENNQPNGATVPTAAPAPAPTLGGNS